VLLAVQMWYHTYSVLDAGKSGVPHLTASETHWLHLVHVAPGYVDRWKYLRFVDPAAAPRLDSAPPLIVYDPDGWTPDIQGSVLFHVIGQACNAFYSPPTYQYIGPSSASCSVRPGFPPVPGGEQYH
jgi:hypothetical protein